MLDSHSQSALHTLVTQTDVYTATWCSARVNVEALEAVRRGEQLAFCSPALITLYKTAQPNSRSVPNVSVLHSNKELHHGSKNALLRSFHGVGERIVRSLLLNSDKRRCLLPVQAATGRQGCQRFAY
ncbi:uncharacterized [Tachysurus ichikawai]